MGRATIVHENFLRRVAQTDFPDGDPPSGPLTSELAVSIYRSACLTRALDRESRAMQAAGQGYYTIGSSGHEGMAAVAAALRPTDMAFLHYRDAAFQIQRAEQVPGQTIAWDMLLSFACSSEDPISGGRHKVLGSKALDIPPQTSTIASHLPKAVGAAYSIGLARRRPPEFKAMPDDAIVYCSFGDASVNHSTAQGAFNTAGWTSYQAVPLPLLFVCEDNGIGISTKTPKGWIKANFANRPALKYFECDGLDIYRDLSRSAGGGAIMSAPGASRPSCIFARSGSMAMPGPTSRWPIFRRTRSRPRRRTTRCCTWSASSARLAHFLRMKRSKSTGTPRNA